VIVAPGVFSALGRPAAGNLLARIFPSYYLMGTACGLVALGGAVLLFLFESGARGLRAFQISLVLLMLAGNVYAGTILRGRLDALRQEGRGVLTRAERALVDKRFSRLHDLSVTLNICVLGLGMTGLGTAAARKKR